jgi:hypothetical protein
MPATNLWEATLWEAAMPATNLLEAAMPATRQS